jgi:hypothetical protein
MFFSLMGQVGLKKTLIYLSFFLSFFLLSFILSYRVMRFRMSYFWGEVPHYLCKFNERIGEYDRRSFELTWVSEDDKASTIEMASPPVALVPLVVQIHDEGGVSSEAVRFIAGSARLNGCTI